MKKNIFFLAVMALVLMNTGCYDRDVIESKDGVSLPTVVNLSSTLSGREATLSWNIPTNISQEMNRPLSVNVQVFQYKPGILSPVRRLDVTLTNEAISATYEVPDDGNEYHAVVKLVGTLKDVPYGHSGLIYSLGQTVVLK